MKGKRLLILGAAFALGISACAQATTLVRKTPLKTGSTISCSLVTSADDLSAGDDIAIGSAASGSVKFLSTTQSTNNRPATSSAGSASNGSIVLPNDTEILTLGEENDHWTLYANSESASGYLYAASSSKNWLRTQENNDANGEWTISIASSGAATVTSQGSYSRNILKFNSSDSLFSCYASGQKDVYLWKVEGSSDPIPEPSVETRTLKQFIDGSDTKAVAFNVTATIKSWKNASSDKDKYGNMVLTDGTNDLVIYGSTATASALAWNNADAYVFTNPQDFLTDTLTSSLVVGHTITMKLIRSDYQGIVQGQGIVLSIAAVEAESVDITEAEVEIERYGLVKLNALLTPNNATSSITWLSSNESVATVDENGFVSGVGIGEATITAKVSNSVLDTCSVTVVEETCLEAFFGPDYNSQEISTYTDSWYSTNPRSNFRVDIENANNNKNGWEFIAFGRKDGNTSTGLITTHEAIANPIQKVVLNIEQANEPEPTITLRTSSNNGSTWVPVGTFTYAVGEQELAISSPASNLSYSIEIDCPAGSANGYLRIASVIFVFGEEGVGPVVPTAEEQINALPTRTALSYNYSVEGNEVLVTDTLNNANTINSTEGSYSEWTYNSTSGVSYDGQSAGSNGTIQLRSSNSNSGIVVKTNSNGYVAKKITINWNSGTDSARIIDAYGKNAAYSAPSDLYNNSNSGTKIGSLACADQDSNKSTTLVVEGSYEYIGLRSHTNALYIDSVVIEWGTAASYSFSRVALIVGGFISQDLWNELDGENHAILGYGVVAAATSSLNGHTIKNMYDELEGDDAFDILDSDVCDGTTIRNFYTPLTENKTNPAEADETQKTEQQVDVNDTYYVWSLRKNITNYNEAFSAIAYIRLADKLVFFKEVSTTAKQAAQDLIDNGIYDGGAFDGSLGAFVK